MTVADLEQRLTMRELIHWQTFEEDFGPITLQERVDAAMTAISYTTHASSGGKEPIGTFRPRWQSSKPVDMMAWLRARAG